MINSNSDHGWRPMGEAPKDGTWILGFCPDRSYDTVYTVMRWWDGIMPEEDDDLSTDEVGAWIGFDDRAVRKSTAWLPFLPHPDAPPPTVSIDHYDGLDGISHRPRAERGITQAEIDETRALYAQFEAEQDARLAREEEDEWTEAANDDSPNPGGHAA